MGSMEEEEEEEGARGGGVDDGNNSDGDPAPEFAVMAPTTQFPTTAFSDKIPSNSKKVKTKRNRMMGWIEKGP